MDDSFHLVADSLFLLNMLDLYSFFFMVCKCSMTTRLTVVVWDLQRELYPALVLFPAENETSVSYEGDMAVASIVEFLADYGSHSHNLINEKGNAFFFCTELYLL